MTFLKLEGGIIGLPYEDQMLSRMVCAAVVEGLWPWRPETVDLMMDFDIDFNKYRLLARARGPLCPTGQWPWDLAYTVPLDRDEIVDYPDGYGWIHEVQEEFIKAFRNREDWFIDDNIQLGEN